jgi:DNA-binding PadR family transcriptional regulator
MSYTGLPGSRQVPSKSKQQPQKSVLTHFLHRPQGAPRGLLQFYILHRISERPTHGYEIAQDIEEKTEGAWRPAPGSIYPMLKKLLDENMIRSVSSGAKSKASETGQRVYEITPEGVKCLKEAKSMFAGAGQKWSSMRRIFMDFMDPEQISEFLVEGSKVQFQMSQELIDSKLSKLSPSDVEFTLKEYALNLEKQLNWTRGKLSQLEKKSNVAVNAQITKTAR